MPILYTIQAVCDKCRAEIEPLQPVMPTDIAPVRWEWKRRWKERGVMQGLPSRYGKYKLFCPDCAGK